jgi:rSAM/selenodomain-associated transferase 2
MARRGSSRVTGASSAEKNNHRTVTVLIPALNEADRIAAIVRRAAEALPGQEIIVIDAGSVDGTAAIAADGATVRRSTASRGASLNEAALASRGDVLLFLHADTLLPADAGDEIARLLADPRVVGGAFRLVFDDRSMMSRANGVWVNARSLAFNVFLGDQALFVRKDVFVRAGGFRDWNLMEDLEILGRLRRFGRLRMTRSAVVTSARRHVRHGWFRTTGTVWLMTWLYFFGVPNRILAGIYRRRASG